MSTRMSDGEQAALVGIILFGLACVGGFLGFMHFFNLDPPSAGNVLARLLGVILLAVGNFFLVRADGFGSDTFHPKRTWPIFVALFYVAWWPGIDHWLLLNAVPASFGLPPELPWWVPWVKWVPTLALVALGAWMMRESD